MRKGLTPKQQADATAATNQKLKAYGAIVRDPRLNGTDIRVAWRIIDRMNVKFRSNPGHLLISEELSLTRQTVVRSTGRLEGFGYLDIAKGGGKGKSNTYTLKRETVRDDGHHEKRPRSADTVRGLKQYCPSTSSKGVRDDGQEPIIEPIREPIRSGSAALPPDGGGAPLKKKECLQGKPGTKTPPNLPPTLPSLKPQDGISKTDKSEAYARRKLSEVVGWEVMLAVEDTGDENHLSAVKACRREAKRLGVTWEPPATGTPKLPVVCPARIKPHLDTLRAEGFTPEVALAQLKTANQAAA